MAKPGSRRIAELAVFVCFHFSMIYGQSVSELVVPLIRDVPLSGLAQSSWRPTNLLDTDF